MFHAHRKSKSARHGGEQRTRTRSYQPRVELLESRELLSSSPATAQQLQVLAQSPLSFEPNQGQSDAQVRFLAHGLGYGLFLTDTGAVFELQHAAAGANSGVGGEDSVFSMDLVGAQAHPQIVGLDELPGKSNYFVGNDPRQWQHNVANYGKVAYHGVYPGVDLLYYGNQGQLEYDLVVAPGSNPQVIRLAFNGVQQLTIDAAGDLVVHLPGGTIVNHAPVVYQESAGGRQAIAGRYVLEGNNQVGFAVGAYDAGRPLIIDPVEGFSTQYGGVYGDEGLAVAVDKFGDLYVTGWAVSYGLATYGNPYQSDPRSESISGASFTIGFDPNGQPFATTYFGGTHGVSLGATEALAIAIGNQGNVHLGGITDCYDLPTTPNASQRIFPVGSSEVGWYAELTPGLSTLVKSSYTPGGNGITSVQALAVDQYNNVFMAGYNNLANSPTTSGATHTTALNKVFVREVNSNDQVLYSATLPGGHTWDFYNVHLGLTLDPNGHAIVASQTASSALPTTPGAVQPTLSGTDDAFVAVLDSSGRVIAATYYGNNARATGVTTDAAGNICITGTNSSGIFVAKFTPNLTGVLYYKLVGSGVSTGIAGSPSGIVWVTGYGNSSNLAVTPDAIQKTIGGGYDAIVGELDTTQPVASSVLYLSYKGGSKDDFGMGIAVDLAGNVYVGGFTLSNDFPTTPGARQRTNNGYQDYFAEKLVPSAPVTHFLVSTWVSSVSAGTWSTITVTALDANNNVVQSYQGTVTFTSSDPQAILPANYAFQPSDHGQVTFPGGVTLFTAGWQWVMATDTVNPSVTSNLAFVTVIPGQAAFFVIAAPSFVGAGTYFTVTVYAMDNYGNIDTNYNGTVQLISTDPAAASLTATCNNGVASFFNYVLPSPGPILDFLVVSDTATQTIIGYSLVFVL